MRVDLPLHGLAFSNSCYNINRDGYVCFVSETTPKASLPLESESPGVPKTTRAQPPVPVGGAQIQPPPSVSAKERTGDTHAQVDSTTQHEKKPEGSARPKRSENSQKAGRRERNYNNAYGRQDDWRGHRGEL